MHVFKREDNSSSSGRFIVSSVNFVAKKRRTAEEWQIALLSLIREGINKRQEGGAKGALYSSPRKGKRGVVFPLNQI